MMGFARQTNLRRAQGTKSDAVHNDNHERIRESEQMVFDSAPAAAKDVLLFLNLEGLLCNFARLATPGRAEVAAAAAANAVAPTDVAAGHDL
jgi:hypothetical protein